MQKITPTTLVEFTLIHTTVACRPEEEAILPLWESFLRGLEPRGKGPFSGPISTKMDHYAAHKSHPDSVRSGDFGAYSPGRDGRAVSNAG